MNVTSLITVDYENIANWTLGENKPNSKPIKPKTNPKQTQNKPKTNPILSAIAGFYVASGEVEWRRRIRKGHLCCSAFEMTA